MRRRFRSDSVSQGSLPQPNHVHNHEPSRGPEIIVKFLVVLASLPVAWMIGWFLLDQMGVRDPGPVLAKTIVIIPAAAIMLMFLSRRVERILDRRYEHLEIMAEKQVEAIRYQQRMQSSLVADTRTQGDQQRFAALVIAVMAKAYDYLAKNNTDQFPGNKRPWSRRSAGTIVLYSLGEKSPVGEAMGDRVRTWLENHDIIDDAGQIDLDRYPDLASIQRLLHLPITIRQGRALGPGQMEGGETHSIIDL